MVARSARLRARLEPVPPDSNLGQTFTNHGRITHHLHLVDLC
jgi:hypothetical protein